MSDRKKSKYAKKRDSGKQMYGPGCCGHKLTMAQLDKHRAEVRESRHFFWTPGRDAEEAARQTWWERQKQSA